MDIHPCQSFVPGSFDCGLGNLGMYLRGFATSKKGPLLSLRRAKRDRAIRIRMDYPFGPSQPLGNTRYLLMSPKCI
jgi:hypothetical protein